jgi:hypothetical protein
MKLANKRPPADLSLRPASALGLAEQVAAGLARQDTYRLGETVKSYVEFPAIRTYAGRQQRRMMEVRRTRRLSAYATEKDCILAVEAAAWEAAVKRMEGLR